MEELVLRIQAVLKRSQKTGRAEADRSRFVIGDYVFDYGRQVLAFGGRNQKLTHKEAELLKLLCLHMNAILERSLALNLIWGDDSFFNGRSMDVFITRLRKHLKADERIEIANVHGKGFRLTVTAK